MTDRLTIMIAVRNGAATIERAVRSCADETRVPLLLIDDHSTDNTVALARAASGDTLRVIAAPNPGGVAPARQAGLDAVDTPFAAWLDADDEWIPGRMSRMVAALESGCDVSVDAVDLHDGDTGAWLKRLTIPGFLRVPDGAVRLFERNFLPGDSQVGFRVAAFREAGGYDATLFGPESYDILLRVLARGAHFSWCDTVGYRMYAYPDSVSRNVARQREAVARALRKHSYETVRGLYLAAGYRSRVAAWALVSMALFREEPAEALRLLETASPADADASEILEPDGPLPVREGWRRAFTQGAALLLLGEHDVEALEACQAAERLEPTPEGVNNLGVALARLGELDAAHRAWEEAARRFPGYADARANATAPTAFAITSHPLRRQASRNDYR